VPPADANGGSFGRHYRTMTFDFMLHRFLLCRYFAAAMLAAGATWPPVWPASAAEPSFACTGKLTPTEAAICKDEDLAALDRTLAAAFKAKLDAIAAGTAHADDDDRDAVAITQKGWIAHRNACGTDKACIRKAYALRTATLTAGPNTPSTPCRDTVGAKQAAVYVKQCLQVATATHPPCNAENSCELIISHNIDRCGFLGGGNPVPKFCATLPKPQ
jgi:uncharacterized protein